MLNTLCSSLQAQLQTRQAEVKKLKLSKAAAEAKALSVVINDRTEGEADIESPDQGRPHPSSQSVKAPPVPTAPPLPPQRSSGPTHILFLPPHVATRPVMLK